MRRCKRFILVLVLALFSMSACQLLDAAATRPNFDQPCHNQEQRRTPKGHEVDFCCEQQALFVSEFHPSLEGTFAPITGFFIMRAELVPVLFAALPALNSLGSDDHLAALCILRI
jgi:hypothetical protein